MATLAPSFLLGSSLFLEVTRTSIKSLMSSNFDQIRSLTAELSAKSLFCVVATLASLFFSGSSSFLQVIASLFFSGSSSFLQVTRITTMPRMSSNFHQVRPLTAELSALEWLIFCVVASLASLFFSGSSSFLQVTRITTISQMS